MKRLTTRLMIVAATLAAATGIAAAQTMEAKIPFAFRANGKALTAGTYRVTLEIGSGIALLTIRGYESKQNLLALPIPGGDPKPAWKAVGDAVLNFRCADDRCALSDVWMGSGDRVYRLHTPVLRNEEAGVTIQIPLSAVKVD